MDTIIAITIMIPNNLIFTRSWSRTWGRKWPTRRRCTTRPNTLWPTSVFRSSDWRTSFPKWPSGWRQLRVHYLTSPKPLLLKTSVQLRCDTFTSFSALQEHSYLKNKYIIQYLEKYYLDQRKLLSLSLLLYSFSCGVFWFILLWCINYTNDCPQEHN